MGSSPMPSAWTIVGGSEWFMLPFHMCVWARLPANQLTNGNESDQGNLLRAGSCRPCDHEAASAATLSASAFISSSLEVDLAAARS